MPKYNIHMRVTVGYVAEITANNEDEAMQLAEANADYSMGRGWGCEVDFLSTEEVE